MTDSEYEAARNKLIPHAMAVADRVAGKVPKWMESQAKWSQRWNRVFLDEMDRLAEAENLTRPFGEVANAKR